MEVDGTLHTTWFAFNGEAIPAPEPSERIGASGEQILQELGYELEQIKNLRKEGIVLGTEWSQ